MDVYTQMNCRWPMGNSMVFEEHSAALLLMMGLFDVIENERLVDVETHSKLLNLMKCSSKSNAVKQVQ